VSVLHCFLGRDRIASSDFRDYLSILRINDGELQVCHGTLVPMLDSAQHSRQILNHRLLTLASISDYQRCRGD
jgi:hypothetical protein